MNICRKIKAKRMVEVQCIEIGACFLYGSVEDLYIRSRDEHNTDIHYSISATRLGDGMENRFKQDAMVRPVGATIEVEE